VRMPHGRLEPDARTLLARRALRQVCEELGENLRCALLGSGKAYGSRHTACGRFEPSIVNTAALDAGASYFENEDTAVPQLVFASNRPGGPGGLDIYISEQNADGSFGAGVLVEELNTEVADQAPDVRHDGLEMFLMSNRTGTIGLAELWVSTRQTVFDLWSPPTNLGPLVNTAFNEGQPSLSSDRQTLYFYSDRPGGNGGNDLYLTTRIRIKGGR
jgi:WD40-like Beta Propeller Repeat